MDAGLLLLRRTSKARGKMKHMGRRLAASKLQRNPQAPRLNDLLLLFILCLTTPSVVSATPPTTRPHELPSGEPSWLGLESSVAVRVGEEEKAVRTLSKTAQWFECYSHSVTEEQYRIYMLKHGERLAASEPLTGPFVLSDPLPHPKTLADVPDNDRGVQLSLAFSPAEDPSAIRFNLMLSSSGRAVWAENDWRPFLFAFFIDGKPYVPPQPGQIHIDRIVPSPRLLLPKGGGERRWRIQVAQQSLRNLLPDEKPHKLTVFASFSEREPVPSFGKESRPDGSLPPEGHEGSQVLVRSNPAEVSWDGKEWIVPEITK